MSAHLQRGLLSVRPLDDFTPRKAVAPSPKHWPVPKLHAELRELILATRERVAQAVNSGLTLLYWQVGDRIRREVLNAAIAAETTEEARGIFTRVSQLYPEYVGALQLDVGDSWGRLLRPNPAPFHASNSSPRESPRSGRMTSPAVLMWARIPRGKICVPVRRNSNTSNLPGRVMPSRS